jgi:hypothetical protein
LKRNLRAMPLWAASRAGNIDIFCSYLFWMCFFGIAEKKRPYAVAFTRHTLERPQYCIRKIYERIAQQLERKRKGKHLN